MSKKVKDRAENKAHSRKDVFYWTLAIVVIAGSIVADHVWGMDVMWAVRLGGWIVVTAIVIALLAFTDFGKKSWSFIQDSRVEMRKVSWPARHETMRTTMIVAGLTLLTALILWGVDSILLWLVGYLTGQRG
ncbi:MAG: preprotein translocase subunit SecE [Gammaproteobacteria bacterium]|nr:preprotein translocase subunit SecE [Gammaproteobacteria bacterium]